VVIDPSIEEFCFEKFQQKNFIPFFGKFFSHKKEKSQEKKASSKTFKENR